MVAQGNSSLDAWPGIEEAAGTAEVVEADDVGIRLDKGRAHLLVGADRCVHDIAGVEDAALRLLMDRLPFRARVTDRIEFRCHSSLVVHRDGFIRRKDHQVHSALDLGLGTGRGHRVHKVFSATSGDEHGDLLNPEPWGILPRRHRQSRGWVWVRGHPDYYKSGTKHG